MKHIKLVPILILFFYYQTNAQITLNLVDSIGFKQGKWKEFKIPFDIATQYIGIKIPKVSAEYYFLTQDRDRKYFPIVECIGEYKDGLKTGIWLEYYSSGNIKSQIEYKKGIPDGMCEIYWESGNLKMKCVIKSETYFPITIYNEDGSILHKQRVTKSEVLKSIYEN